MADARSEESLLENLGASVVHRFQVARGLISTLLSALQSVTTPGIGAREVVHSITIRQIFYTSFQALPMIGVVALFIGATLTAQTEILGGAVQRETAGRILVAVVLREFAPLITAFIVAGRSGTAIASELGVMRVNKEILGLASLGIDPPRFLVWPRIVATTLSIPLLTIYFSALAIIGGNLAAFLIDAHGVADWQTGAMMALGPADLPLVFIKTIGLGGLVGWLCSYYGLEVGASPTEIPQKASRAVVQTLLACIIYNAIVTIAFYWVVGASLS
jgi:phospholipid/cholesterol/gamma-HCH transport system permease protein